MGRGVRYYQQSDGFKGVIKVTGHDQPSLSPAKRGWLLLVYENRFLAAGVLAGILLVAAAFIVARSLPLRLVLPFLVRSDLPVYWQPGFWGR